MVKLPHMAGVSIPRSLIYRQGWVSSYGIIAIFYCNEDLYLRAPSFNILRWHMDKLVLIKYVVRSRVVFFQSIDIENQYNPLYLHGSCD